MSGLKKKNIFKGQVESVNVLVVDDDSGLDRLILSALARKGIRADLVSDMKSAVKLFENNEYRLVFINENISARRDGAVQRAKGFELLRFIVSSQPELPVVMIADGDDRCELVLETAVSAIRQGCCDVITQKASAEKIERIFDRIEARQKYGICDEVRSEDKGSGYRIIGSSIKLSQTISMAKRIAVTNAPVLISGESGTGKELIAALVHHHSRRSEGTYVRVNCAALNDSLLESELFGHEKGAFTGAAVARQGRFEMANGGTLLLDEITETSLKFQAKLLRVLELQDFERVGGNQTINVDVRIISTTNKDLKEEVRAGRFRADLYYRLSSLRVITAPLRQRPEDIIDLTWYFVNLYGQQANRCIKRLDESMIEIFKKYHWPGNVRQLRNVVMTSLVLGAGETLALADVSWLFDELDPVEQENTGRAGFLQSDGKEEMKSDLGGIPLENIEKRAILDTLRQTDGNQTKAANILGISDRTLRDRLKRYKKQTLETVG